MRAASADICHQAGHIAHCTTAIARASSPFVHKTPRLDFSVSQYWALTLGAPLTDQFLGAGTRGIALHAMQGLVKGSRTRKSASTW